MNHDLTFWECLEYFLLNKDPITDSLFGIRDGDKQFFNITTLWKLAGQDPLNKPDDFLRLEETKYAIVGKWENDTGKRFKYDMEYYCKNTHKKRLEEQHEKEYIKTTRGRCGATYVDEDLLIRYAITIDKTKVPNLIKNLLKQRNNQGNKDA